MYCKMCKRDVGTPENVVCPFCGSTDLAVSLGVESGGAEKMSYSPSPPPQPSINQTPYLIFSILATIMCCPPLGIPAIVFASQINSAEASGDYERARGNAKKAKIFTIISASLGAAVVIFYFLFVAFAVFSDGYSYY